MSSLQSNFYSIRKYEAYRTQQKGADGGKSVCDKAKQIVGLLQDKELLASERENAQKLRKKMGGCKAKRFLQA